MATTFKESTPPADGQEIHWQAADHRLEVPDRPIIPFIEGDGTGPDIWRATRRVLDGAVEKAYGGSRSIACSRRWPARRHTTSPRTGYPRPRSTPSSASEWPSRDR